MAADGIAGTLGNLFDFFNSIIEFIKSALEIIVGILLNPLGALNQGINYLTDLIGAILPSTPDELKVGSIIQNIGSDIPLIGSGLIKTAFDTFSQLIGIATVIKIYKLIPFKAT
jgi:hypothetical protein